MNKSYIKLQATDNMDKDYLLGCHLGKYSEVFASDGSPLHLIASMSLASIASLHDLDLSKLLVSNDSRLYFFSYYEPDDYFIEHISYYGTTDELNFFTDGFTQGIVAGENTYDFGETITFSFEAASAHETSSFIGCEPEFLQNERYEALSDYLFIGQISGFDLPTELQDLFFFAENIGYFFVKKDLTEGRFFVQST